MVVGKLPTVKTGATLPLPKKEKKDISERMNAILVQAVSKNTPMLLQGEIWAMNYAIRKLQ